MCKYCKIETKIPEDSGYVLYLKDKYNDHHFATLGFFPYEGVVNIGADAFNVEYEAEIKINYCPMCGRKLGESE